MTRAFLLLALLFSLNITPAFAADKPAAEPALPEPLVKLRDEGAQMKYLGRDLGYDGWIAVQNGQEQYFYVTPDGSAFFLGLLFNKNGRVVTFDQMQRLKGSKDPILNDLLNAPSQTVEDNVPTPAADLLAKKEADKASKVANKTTKPDASSPAEQLFADVNNARWFVMGNKTAPAIYTFVDPRCPHCKELLNDLKPYIDGGKVQVRVVPVGALTPESRPMAAYLLNAKDASERLTRLMAGDQTAIPTDSTAPAKDVDANLDVLLKWKFSATPITVYRGKDGTVKLLQGRADDTKSFISDLP